MTAMKLYVWADPYAVNYGSSMLMAVAADLDQAKIIAATSAKSYSFGKYEDDEIPLNVNLGAPTRVVELPCAEWHMWSE